MNKPLLWLACLPMLATGLFSCSGKSDSQNAVPNPEFKIAETIIGLSRSPQLDANGAGKFSIGDKNTLFFHSAQQNNLTTFVYTYGQKYYWDDLRLPSSGADVMISACYPTVETRTPENFMWDVNNHNPKDILLAAPVMAKQDSPTPIELSFSHVLHKLVVALHPDEAMNAELLEQASVVCRNVLPVANLNLLSGKAVSASGNKCEMAGHGTQSEFIIPSQDVNDMELVIRLGEREVIYPLSAFESNGTPLKHLQSGMALTVRIKVGKTSFTIAGQDISGWENQGDINGSVEI